MSGAGRRIVVVALLVIVAALALGLRRGLVVAFFPDGASGADPALTPAPADAPSPPAVDRVRVVLVDGLGAATADALPELSRVCATGVDLRIDIGFPTVSLPVQHALWTGRTQSQSGVMYRVAGIDAAPADALPARVPGSIAVAESHRDIVHSFGFGDAQPPLDDASIETPGSVWRREGFAVAAERAVSSDSPLVFVHVLRVDEAGHASGAASSAYREAAASADALLGPIVAADPGARWFLLADHGHRPGGGHGGAEPEIRVVRACVVGPGIGVEDRRSDPPVHLVDLHRAIADGVGVGIAPGSLGRPLAFAAEHPDPDATLPRPSTPAVVAAFALVLAAIVAVARSVGTRVGAWPWWVPVAYVGVVSVHGAITLSNPVVYPPLGGAVLLAAAPGAVVLAVSALPGLRRDGLGRTLVAQLVPAALLVAAALSLVGVFGRVLGLHARPPLVPIWTAHASVGFSLLTVGAVAFALVVAVSGRAKTFR